MRHECAPRPYSSTRILYKWTRRGGCGVFVEPGPVRVPSGEVVVCDPLAAMSNARALDRRVTPGTYGVELTLAIQGDDARVALATIYLADDEIVSRCPLPLLGGHGRSLVIVALRASARRGHRGSSAPNERKSSWRSIRHTTPIRGVGLTSILDLAVTPLRSQLDLGAAATSPSGAWPPGVMRHAS
jgi:hypothetical protein